jgi:hypothetical protein
MDSALRPVNPKLECLELLELGKGEPMQVPITARLRRGLSVVF